MPFLYSEEAVISTSAPANKYLIIYTADCTPVLAASYAFTLPFNKAITTMANLFHTIH